MAGFPLLSRWATMLWRASAVTTTSPVTAGGSVAAAPATRISTRWGPAGTWIGSVTRSGWKAGKRQRPVDVDVGHHAP